MGCFSGVGLGLLVLVKGNLNASAYQDIMHNAMLLGIVWGKPYIYFSMTAPQCTKQALKRHGWGSLGWKNLTGPHRALTSTPSSTFDELKWRLRANA